MLSDSRCYVRELMPGQRAMTAAVSSGPAATGVSIWPAAESFLRLFYAEEPAAQGTLSRRLERVRLELALTGTYRHTPAELTFAARVAWRNSSRCIGRLYWRRLRVRDRREVSTAADVAAEVVDHLREATNGGRIQPLITVFAPDTPGRQGPRILSSQVLSYAGYQEGHQVTGDPANVELTRLARLLGWPGRQPPGRFDILPLIVQGADGGPSLHEIPADAVLEVPLHHPRLRWFAGLGLRWYAVPMISDMYLEAGGIRYPAAPFNGWYMCTEVGSRDLGDASRYDQLPVVAEGMGLDTSTNRSLWKDMALTELNIAVVHSFKAARVTVTDHHTEAARFLKHLVLEEAAGRRCPADWSWIVPPAASSATPVFHRYYDNFDATPNFYRYSGDLAAAVAGRLSADPRPRTTPAESENLKLSSRVGHARP